LREDVAHAATTIGLSIDSVFTMLVIQFTLLSITQDIVGSRKLLELGWVTSFIGVLSNSSFTEVLLHLICCSSLFNSKKVIQLAVVYLLLRTSALATEGETSRETTISIIVTKAAWET